MELFVSLILWAISVGIIYKLTSDHGRSLHFLWLPLLLSWIGGIIAAVIIVHGSKKEKIQ